MRRSIALFLTLIFLTILLGIVGSIIGIYKKISKNSFEKDMSQNSILIKNIAFVLNNISKDINGSDVNKLYQTFFISSSNGDFRVVIKVKPLLDKVDINTYKDKTKEKYIDMFLDNILEFYQIKDPVLFKSLIKDTLDTDNIERVEGSEIRLYNPFFKNGKIYNFKHFEEILDYYVKLTNDKEIYKIPWKDLIWFGNGKSIIDCNIINKKVAKFLGLMFDEDNLNCKALESYEENKDILDKLDIIPFTRKNPYFIEITVNYNNQKLNILYNLVKKRIENIESNYLY